ncbi:hypothetical protein MKW94_024055 [Papaver nudicaule]|uniref:Uncharacterized protein n=1 Tax=Papaver nudicaule TaxID=74823 RepID=A0AA42B581_PAPNU|nr:hypothetical protein [Papaver nudicaule]
MSIEYVGEIYELVDAEEDVDTSIHDEADQCLGALFSGVVDMEKMLSYYLRIWDESEKEQRESKKRFEKCSRKKLLMFCDYLKIQNATSFGKFHFFFLPGRSYTIFFFEWVEHKAAKERHKKIQEEELKKIRKLEEPSYEDIQTAPGKALKIALRIGKPPKNLVKIASKILDKKLDAEDENVKRALTHVLENYEGNGR